MRRRAPTGLTIEGKEVPLRIRRSDRARRMLLRVESREAAVILVLPRKASVREGLQFIEEKTDWIARRLDSLPPRVPFLPGAVVPLLGDDHVIAHDPDLRGGVRRDAGTIRVHGHEADVPTRVRVWLRREARRELSDRARAKAAQLGRRLGRITVRDTRSRWGSCSSSGNLNFSWRLYMAPETVADYVVAHEVAHLAEMNHGPRFWDLVSSLTDDVAGARHWLRQEGAVLHRYG